MRPRLLSELKVAFRSLRARPLFSFIDVMTLGLAVAAMVAACALLSSSVPALRATRIDPITALRTE